MFKLPITQKPKFKERDNFMFALFGANRTGKTTLLKALAADWRKSHPGCKVISFDPQHLLQGISDEYILLSEEKTWVSRVLKMRNCLLIIDEFRLLHQDDKSSSDLRSLLAYWAQYNIDIMMTFHSPGLVLTALTYYITHYMVFYTQATKEKFKDKLSNFEIVVNASAFINRYVEQEGLGTYPVFPYVCVNNKTGELTAVNFKQSWVDNYTKTMALSY